MRRLLPIFFVAAAGIAAAGFQLLRPEPAAEVQTSPALRVEREGIRLDVDLRAAHGGPVHAGIEAIATFTLTEAASGDPVRGVHPRAWLSAAHEDAGTCEERVQRFGAGRLSARADADFNETWVLAMNADNTISVIDANLAFDRTKLRSLVSLPAPAADWALHPDRTAVYVSIPGADTVSVIDTSSLQARGSIAVGVKPGRLAIAPDARRIWVSNDGGQTVTVIDHQTRRPVDHLEAGEGPRRIAFGRELAWVTSDGSGELFGFDAFTLEQKVRLAIGEGPLVIAASPTARAAWVGRPDGELVEIDERSGEVRRRLRLEAGLSELRFDPSGRWAFALFLDRGEVAVIDASSGAVRAVLEGFRSPDAIAFSERYAYVRERARPSQVLIDLRALPGGGEIPLAEVVVGQTPPEDGAHRALATPMAPIAGGGMIVPSPADRTLLYYAEGMMAPMGALRNYGREPRAALLLDRSLLEVQPGLYRTQVKLPAAGEHDLTVFLDQPRLALCLRVPIAPVPGSEPAAAPIRIEPAFDPEAPLQAGVDNHLRFRIEGAEGLRAEEIAAVAFRPPGTWQWRGAAAAAEADTFELVIRPPAPGRIKLVVGLPGRSLPVGSLPPFDLPVAPTATASADQEELP